MVRSSQIPGARLGRHARGSLFTASRGCTRGHSRFPVAISLAINIADFACREPRLTRTRAGGPLGRDRWGSLRRHARGRRSLRRVVAHVRYAHSRLPITISLAIKIGDFACREPRLTRARAGDPLEPDRWGSPRASRSWVVVHCVAWLLTRDTRALDCRLRLRSRSIPPTSHAANQV